MGERREAGSPVVVGEGKTRGGAREKGVDFLGERRSGASSARDSVASSRRRVLSGESLAIFSSARTTEIRGLGAESFNSGKRCGNASMVASGTDALTTRSRVFEVARSVAVASCQSGPTKKLSASATGGGMKSEGGELLSGGEEIGFRARPLDALVNGLGQHREQKQGEDGQRPEQQEPENPPPTAGTGRQRGGVHG